MRAKAKAIFFLIFVPAVVTVVYTRRLETRQQVGSDVAFTVAFALI